MRVGLVTSLLWPRYGPFWERLLAQAGLETARAPQERLARALRDKRLESVPGAAFKAAVAEALALSAMDAVLVPELNPGEDIPRGGGQDPWIASFPEALAKSVVGLPPILSVPAGLEEGLESLVINMLHGLTHDPALARRTWEKSRGFARPPRYIEPRWLSPGLVTVGLIGQPWLLGDGALAALAEEGRHLVSQHQLDPNILRQEGARVAERLVATDREVLGAARLMSRKGSVERLIMLVDESSGADRWLFEKARRIQRKPLEAVYLKDLPVILPHQL
jgi:hypothetical protein